jgi:hypothetical protein
VTCALSFPSTHRERTRMALISGGFGRKGRDLEKIN